MAQHAQGGGISLAAAHCPICNVPTEWVVVEREKAHPDFCRGEEGRIDATKPGVLKFEKTELSDEAEV